MKSLQKVLGLLILQAVFCGLFATKTKSLLGQAPEAKSVISNTLENAKAFQKTFRVRKNDSYKKLKFMEIVGSILKTAKKRRLKIKKIQLGSKVKRIFQNPDINNILAQYINDRHFFKKLAIERKRYRKLTTLQRQSNRQEKGSTNKRELANFNFDPKFAGMPFPPFLMNGPHYYPQTELTVNAVPNPYPRGALVKEDIEIQTLQRQSDFLQKIRKDLSENARPELQNLFKQALKATEESRLQVARVTRLLE